MTLVQTVLPKQPKWSGQSNAHIYKKITPSFKHHICSCQCPSGLSNCIMIKELCLTGNKISDVEGLQRLLKLAVLDLNFNRITTTKSLGQLVANHKSSLALNLLGNPIQSNFGDDQVRRTVSNLLPKLTYLNKQPTKPQWAREAVSDNVPRAALGNNGWSSRRKVSRWATQGSSSRRRISEGVAHRSRHRAKEQSPTLTFCEEMMSICLH